LSPGEIVGVESNEAADDMQEGRMRADRAMKNIKVNRVYIDFVDLVMKFLLLGL